MVWRYHFTTFWLLLFSPDKSEQWGVWIFSSDLYVKHISHIIIKMRIGIRCGILWYSMPWPNYPPAWIIHETKTITHFLLHYHNHYWRGVDKHYCITPNLLGPTFDQNSAHLLLYYMLYLRILHSTHLRSKTDCRCKCMREHISVWLNA